MKYLGTIINSGLFSNIEENNYIAAYKQLSVISKTFKKGSLVMREGELNNKICIVHSGCIRGEKLHEDGEIQIVQIYQENTIFGLESAVSQNRNSVMNYFANENSEIIYVSMEDLVECDYFAQINESLIYGLAEDNIDKLNKINILGHRGLREKIMMALTAMDKKTIHEGETFRIRMNQDQLARYLRVNRSALSKELNLLKKEGIIDFCKDEFCILKK